LRKTGSQKQLGKNNVYNPCK